MNQRLYIIFTTGNIRRVGGMEMYISGIARYLERNGFDVVVYYPGPDWGDCVIRDLDKYVIGGCELLSIEPALYTAEERDRVFKHCISKAGIRRDKYTEIFIESQADVDSLWAEYFAKRLDGKHILQLLNELYDAEYMLYSEYIDFYWKLYVGKRLRGGLLSELFINNGLSVGEIHEGWCIERYPIDEVDLRDIGFDQPYDYRIAYIGRGNKEYVPTVIDEVCTFANNHLDKSIQFIFVGDCSCQKDLIESRIYGTDNLSFLPLGNLVPIPRALFSKVKVVIANSQTAFFCAQEGVYVVTVSTIDNLSSGVLGYDCHADCGPNYRESYHESISVVLENLLINEKYQNRKRILPKRRNPDEVYSRSIIEFERLSPIANYEDVENHVYKKNPIQKRKRLDVIRQETLKWRIDFVRLSCSQIGIFGAGCEGSKCISWIISKGYELSFVIDNAQSKWNKKIDGFVIDKPDVLCEKPVDYIVICCIGHSDEIAKQLLENYGFERNQLTTFSCIRYYSILG